MSSDAGLQAVPRPPVSDLEQLAREPFRYDFFQVVRLILLRCAPSIPGDRGVARLRKAIRFRSQVSLAFPPSDLVSLELHDVRRPTAQAPAADLEVAFFGLAGHQGPLPDHYAELIQRRRRARDPALGDFLDLFNNRLLSLFYQAWEKPRFFVPAERSEEDPLTTAAFSVLGLGRGSLRSALPFPADMLLAHTGAASRRPVSLESAEQIIGAWLGGIPLEIIPFVGRWVPLEDGSRARLGDAPDAPRLGQISPLGERVWDIQGQIRLRIGPVSAERYRALLPEGAEGRDLARLLAFIAGAHITVSTELRLAAEDVPPARLSAELGLGTQLGINGWLSIPDGAAEALVLAGPEGTSSEWRMHPVNRRSQ